MASMGWDEAPPSARRREFASASTTASGSIGTPSGPDNSVLWRSLWPRYYLPNQICIVMFPPRAAFHWMRRREDLP